MERGDVAFPELYKERSDVSSPKAKWKRWRFLSKMLEKSFNYCRDWELEIFDVHITLRWQVSVGEIEMIKNLTNLLHVL